MNPPPPVFRELKKLPAVKAYSSTRR